MKEEDANGHLLKDWCEPGNTEFDANCIVCHKTIDIRNRGKSQLLAHALTKKHKDHAGGLARNQAKFLAETNDKGQKTVVFDVSSASTGSRPVRKVMSHDDEVAKAELIWTMKVAESGYSYQSCKSLREDFQAMFPDSAIAKSFTLGADKISYEIVSGLGPFFHDEVIGEMKKSTPFYTVSFDEATNDCGNKQLDLHLRWWGNTGIQNYYLCTCILGHATAEIMKTKILDALNADDLNLGQLLMLSSDGPNVNKKLLKLIDEHLKLKIPGHKGLINFGSCNLHIVHNSFAHGINKFD